MIEERLQHNYLIKLFGFKNIVKWNDKKENEMLKVGNYNPKTGKLREKDMGKDTFLRMKMRF